MYGFVFVDAADPEEIYYADKFVRRYSVKAVRRVVEVYCDRAGVQRVGERYPADVRFLRGPRDERSILWRLRAIPGDQFAGFFRGLCEDSFGETDEWGLAHVAGPARGTPAGGAGVWRSAWCPACGTEWATQSARAPLPVTNPQEAPAIQTAPSSPTGIGIGLGPNFHL